ncbi:MAG: cysteine--tRNA ligase [Conexivisphaerales archaeon]
MYDTLTRKEVELDSKEKKTVKAYVCGLTVYDRAHIGHAKSIVFFDVLRRVLRAKGFQLKFVQNFTDVDDKIIDKAEKLRIDAGTLSQRYIEEYFRDFDELNVERADVMPRATENIDEMISMIKGLIEKKYAYVVESGVYLDVTKVKEYGKLSRIRVDELKKGARVEPDPYKKNPLDFALWKFYDSSPSWESPWGRGRPGWHIECSAMIHRFLNEPIDIHGGGEDLLFPHHENEIAQSESLFGRPLSRIWLHVGMVKLEGVKMSKSLGNIVSVRDFLDAFGPNLLRYYVISSHYRKQLDYTEQLVEKAKENWRLIELADAVVSRYKAIGRDDEDAQQAEKSLKAFDQHLTQDMNTSSALAELVRLSRLVSSAFTRGDYDEGKESHLASSFRLEFSTLGFRRKDVDSEQKERVKMMIEQRERLRKDAKYEEADRIRKVLTDMRIAIVDHSKGTLWYFSELLPPKK